MTKINKNIVRAAVLQELAQPYSLIYVDLTNNDLFLAVRTSSPKEKMTPTYSAVETSRREIEDYIHERKSLEDIFKDKKTFGFKLVDNEIMVSEENQFHPDKTFYAMNWFDSEYCEEEGWIDVFLTRNSAGQHFEII